MKRLISVVAMVALCALASPAVAGDWHNGVNLICSDCHLMHGSQDHGLGAGGVGTYTAIGADAPYPYLLRNEINELCLTCHDGTSSAPDVFGDNGGVAMNRNGGGLNAAAGHRANATGYEDSDGHTLWSKDAAPGGTWANTTEGLECTNCHAQHGHVPTQYRNLATGPGGATPSRPVTYATTTNISSRDVFQRVLRGYSEGDIDYNEPSTSASAYANWCAGCHTDLHGGGGSTNMGGTAGGSSSTGSPWLRHPTADVNIGWDQPAVTRVSNLSRFNSLANRVKVMDSQGLWDGTAADNTVTPSCFSCHKSHGNKNAFGLIFMSGTGTRTEEGDNGTRYNDLCRQCHIQGA